MRFLAHCSVKGDRVTYVRYEYMYIHQKLVVIFMLALARYHYPRLQRVLI